MHSIPLALTYDDVLLVPRHSTIRSRREVDTTTMFTRQVSLKTPLVSANMDTVTESRMAIAMAEFGGIGVVHRFLPIEAEVAEVVKVKRYRSNIVEDPYTVAPTATIAEARWLMSDVGVHGLPVVESDNKLVGMLTRRDIDLADDDQLVSDRMTAWERLVVAAPDVTAAEAKQALFDRRVEKLPLVDAQGRLVGLITAKDLARGTAMSRATRDAKGRLRVAAAVGVIGDYVERAEALAAVDVDAIVLDIAHGDSDMMVTALARLRERLGDVPLVAGNVATAEGARLLIEAGADAIKVGVGPGSMCITRLVAGVGVPQLTAVLECAEVGRELGVPIIADGGIRYAGDVAKAIGAGASTVMMGNLLAGTDESPGFIVNRDGRKMKIARGMASTEATAGRAMRQEPKEGWSSWDTVESETAAEGIQAPVPYRGTALEVLQQLLGGLRSGMSYSDASTVRQMWENARFVRQTEAGFRESAPHDVGSF